MQASRTLVGLGAAGLLLTGCGATGSGANRSSSTPSPPDGSTAGTAVVCANFGGCDVQEDLADGTQVLITLRTSSFATAQSRAQQEARRSTVFDAEVVGHNPPHVTLSQVYYS